MQCTKSRQEMKRQKYRNDFKQYGMVNLDVKGNICYLAVAWIDALRNFLLK